MSSMEKCRHLLGESNRYIDVDIVFSATNGNEFLKELRIGGRKCNIKNKGKEGGGVKKKRGERWGC